MQIVRPNGEPWLVEDAARKLVLRGGLPGAFVFDRAAAALRTAKSMRVPIGDRLALALPASWLVNSPAVSRVLQRWAQPPQRDVWLALVETLEEYGAGASEDDFDAGLALAVRSLGSEPHGIEAASKVLALLVPEVVPLLPTPARVFVLGPAGAEGEGAFAAMIRWFVASTAAHREELDALARANDGAPLSGAQVLDRLLWFDAEGHRHFASPRPGNPAR
jgi:hypothetical protein